MRTISNKENANSANKFLSIFGLVIEEKEEIMPGQRLKVFTENNQEVGHITFYEDEIDIRTQTELGFLHAYFEKPKVTSFEDGEINCAKHSTWQNNIHYNIQKGDIIIKGEYLMEISKDSEFGNRCTIHPTLQYYQDKELLFDLALLRRGNAITFNSYDQGQERFELKPFPNAITPLWHEIKRGQEGEFDRKTWWILNSPATLTAAYAHDKEKNGKYIDLSSSFDIEPKTSKDPKENFIQQGKLMQTLDPNLYKRLRDIRYKLTNNTISLLDSFIIDTLYSHSNEELEALLGFAPQNISIYSSKEKPHVKIYK